MKIIQHQLLFETCPTQMCHASTILKLSNGELLSAWFGGSKEGMDDVSIWMSRKSETWCEPFKIAFSNEPHWNPVLFEAETDRILLFYKIGRQISTWRTMIMESFDHGNTWSDPSEMVPGNIGGRGPVRNKPILLKNGTILAPGSTEDGIWQSFVDCSSDSGKTWTIYDGIKIENLVYEKGSRTVDEKESDIPVSEQSFYGRGVIQPTLWEGEGQNIHMMMRSTEGKIYRSDSIDGGKTWSSAYQTELPNNNSGIDVVKTQDGTLALVYNPIGVNWGPRSPISLALSKDDGKTWIKEMDLDCGEGEFAYPAIIAQENRIYITYTYKRKSIAFWEIEL